VSVLDRNRLATLHGMLRSSCECCPAELKQTVPPRVLPIVVPYSEIAGMLFGMCDGCIERHGERLQDALPDRPRDAGINDIVVVDPARLPDAAGRA